MSRVEVISEEWRIVADYPDYSVSSLGRIMRNCPNRQGRGAFHILKPQYDKDKGARVKLSNDAGPKNQSIGRIVCTAFYGPNSDALAHHIDGDITNNKVDNLCWTDYQGVADTSVALGLYAVGEQNGTHTKPWRVARGDMSPAKLNIESVSRGQMHYRAKLTEDDVRYIRGSTQDADTLASQFSVHPQTIKDVLRRRNWKHVP